MNTRFQYSQGSGRLHPLLQRPESLLFDSVRVSCFAKHRVFVAVHPFQPCIVRSDLRHLGNHENVGQPLLEAVDWADLNEGRLDDAVKLTVNLCLRSVRVNRVTFNELLRAGILCCASSLYASPTPVVEHISPAPTLIYAAPAPTAFDAPAPVVEYFGPAPGRATLGLHLQGFPHQLRYARTHTVCRTRSNGEDLAPEPGVSYAASALTAYAAPASVMEYIVSAPAVSYTAPWPAVSAAQATKLKYIAPAPAVELRCARAYTV